MIKKLIILAPWLFLSYLSIELIVARHSQYLAEQELSHIRAALGHRMLGRLMQEKAKQITEEDR